MTGRSRRAGQGDESRFLPTVEFAVLPPGGRLAMERGVEALGGELLADTHDRHSRGLQRLGDPFIAPGIGTVGVGLKQYLSSSPHGCRPRSSADERNQRPSLLRRQAYHHLRCWGHKRSSMSHSQLIG